MNTLLKVGILLVLTPAAFADVKPVQLLDKVSFQVSAKQWVSTQSALLSVSINMTLTDADLVKARNDILNRLNKVAKGDWHLLDFIRSQDNSGLEKLLVNAQARVEQSALTDIYKNAKAVSMPGAQYQISAVEFKPALEETQAIRAKIREELYKKVLDELSRINKTYPNQNYSLSRLVFTEGDMIPTPRPYQAKELNAQVAFDGQQAPALNVSNELVMNALVDVASNRREG